MDGKPHVFSDVLRCRCGKVLEGHSDYYCWNHVSKCILSGVKPPRYGRPGRPPEKERVKRLEESVFVKHCSNCGYIGCKGGADNCCDLWQPMPLTRCMVCGCLPVLEGDRIICDNCGLSLHDDDPDRLLAKWNGRWR